MAEIDLSEHGPFAEARAFYARLHARRTGPGDLSAWADFVPESHELPNGDTLIGFVPPPYEEFASEKTGWEKIPVVVLYVRMAQKTTGQWVVLSRGTLDDVLSASEREDALGEADP